jgi:hypothetical protein
MPVLVYDLKLARPACVLLSAAMGGTPGVAQQFPTEHWLLAPTPDMKRYAISDEDLTGLIEHHRKMVVGK